MACEQNTLFLCVLICRPASPTLEFTNGVREGYKSGSRIIKNEYEYLPTANQGWTAGPNELAYDTCCMGQVYLPTFTIN